MGKRGPIARLYDALALGVKSTRLAVSNPYGKAALEELHARTGSDAMSRMMPTMYQFGGPGAWQFERAEQIKHFRHWVYACISFLSAKITASPPLVGYAVDPDSAAKHWKQVRAKVPTSRRLLTSIERKSAVGVQPHEEIEYADADHPLRQLLEHPNPHDTAADFWDEFTIFMELCGVNYTWKVPGDGGKTAELWNLPAHWVTPVCTGHDSLIDYYQVMPWGSTQAPLVRFDVAEIIEVKYASPLNKLGSTSPIQAVSEAVDQYESIQQSRYWALKNGANMGAVFELDGGEQAPQDTAIERVEAKLFAKFQGEGKSGRPIILPPGMKLSRFDAASELAYMQSSDQVRDYVISTAYRLSKEALGVAEGVAWATFVGEMRRINSDVLGPRILRRDTHFTAKLASEYDDRLRIFTKLPRYQDDAQRLAEWTGTPGPAVTINEYRTHILELETLDDPQYDHPMSPAGLLPGGPSEGGGPPIDFGEREAAENPGESEAKGLAEWVEKHGAPPFPGAVFNPQSHRWEKPTGGTTSHEEGQAHKAKAIAKTRDSLTKNKNLTNEQKQQYDLAVRSVVNKMTPEAAKRFNENLMSVSFHPDVDSVGQEVAKLSTKTAKMVAEGYTINGAYSSGAGLLVIDGGGIHIGQSVEAKDIYAHEFGHVIDGMAGKRISAKPEWEAAWKAEVEGNTRLSKYGAGSKEEGFAEFSRALHAGLGDKLQASFPKCYAVWQKEGLV